jgi:hypothetical protein
MGEVQTDASSPDEWRKLLPLFLHEFLGRSSNASKTHILNPHVINLARDSSSHFLIASSDSVIRVENNALGYQLSVVLSSFEWDISEGWGHFVIYPRFETLPGATLETRAAWHKNRERSYRGSFVHFLRSLISGTLREEGFTVHIGSITALQQGLSHIITTDDIQLSRVNESETRRLTFQGWLRVEYRGDRHRTSYLSLRNNAVELDDSGHPLNPLLFTMLGDWQDDRLAEMLPNNWDQPRSTP